MDNLSFSFEPLFNQNLTGEFGAVWLIDTPHQEQSFFSPQRECHISKSDRERDQVKLGKKKKLWMKRGVTLVGAREREREWERERESEASFDVCWLIRPAV